MELTPLTEEVAALRIVPLNIALQLNGSKIIAEASATIRWALSEDCRSLNFREYFLLQNITKANIKDIAVAIERNMMT